MNKFITLTWEFIQNKDYTMNEKLVYCEILNLSSLDKGCVASNQHFATMLGVKKEAVSRLISSLENKGVITSKIKNGSRNFSRIITINKMLFDPKQNVISPLTKCLETKENNTINNTYNKESVLLPNWIDTRIWLEWVEYRKEKKNKLTNSTISKQIKFLEKHKDNHIKIIEQSIMNGWTGLFELKDTKEEKTEWTTY